MIAVKLRGVHTYDGVCLYMVRIVLQYATDVKNLIIKNLRLRFWGKIRLWPLLYCKWCGTHPVFRKNSSVARNKRFFTSVAYRTLQQQHNERKMPRWPAVRSPSSVNIRVHNGGLCCRSENWYRFGRQCIYLLRIPFITSALLVLLPPSRNSDPGSHI